MRRVCMRWTESGGGTNYSRWTGKRARRGIVGDAGGAAAREVGGDCRGNQGAIGVEAGSRVTAEPDGERRAECVGSVESVGAVSGVSGN